jgi:proline iminopeptidase
MAGLYPELEPAQQGRLDVGDGNELYWECCGNPDGRPALALHGGPGSGAVPAYRRMFDPAAYRIVVFDQRGAGRSTPPARDPATDMAVNTTAHLVADIERLRTHLGIERWVVLGISWGSTLGLAYAEAYPERVTALVLAAVTTTRRAELDWMHRGGLAQVFPDAYERFLAGAGTDGDPVAAYDRLLNDPDPAVRAKAATDWCLWDGTLISGRVQAEPAGRFADPVFAYGFARVVVHYFAHDAFLEPDQLLRDAERLAGIPGALVHGRLDLGSPLGTAWELAKRWPDAELTIVENAGHTFGGPLDDALIAATDRFRAA